MKELSQDAQQILSELKAIGLAKATDCLCYRDNKLELNVEGLSPELCHVTVQNVRTAAYCSNVRLLNQGGMILHDILVDGVEDMSVDCPYLDYGIYGVNVGDIHMYGSRHSVSGETYNITLRNVKHGGVAAIRLAGVIDNLVTENITVPEIEQNSNARIQIPHGKETVEARPGTQPILDQR